MVKAEVATNFTTNITDKITKDTNRSDTDIVKLLKDNKNVADAYFKNNILFEKTLDDKDKTKVTITPNKDVNDASKIIDYTVKTEKTTK